MIAAWGGADLLEWMRARFAFANALAAAIAVSVLLALGAGAWLQTRHWRDSFSLFQHTVEVVPRNPLIRYNVANRLRDAGQLDAAIQEYERALAETPDSFQIRINLANALRADAKLDEAAAPLPRAARARPGDAQANNGLATILRAQGQQGAAEVTTDARSRASPAASPATTSGICCGARIASRRRLRSIARRCATATAIRSSTTTWAARSRISGDLEGALLHYRIALKLDPAYDVARRNLEHAESLRSSR